VSAAFQHLRRSDYVSMPWKNGAGTTLEIARDPPSPDEFRWRLSLASVSASGPFSSYPGYQRSVTLIEGDGFRLDVQGQAPIQLAESGASVLFPGAATTNCELIADPSTDLSLMVREPGVISSVTLEPCDIVRSFNASPHSLQAFFCLDEGLAFALEDTIIPLARHDTMLLRATDTARCDFTTFRVGARLLWLVWRPG
jgi:environmental stress-induced protein Ves